MDFDHVERDEDYEPTIPDRYNKYVVSSDRSTSLSNAPVMDVFSWWVSNNYLYVLELEAGSALG
jgi:hypothetical protein